MGSNDLFVLLNVLRPDIIIDHPSFEHRAAPNPYINKAIEIARRAGMEWQKEATEALNEAIETEWGKVILRNDPAFQRLLNLLQDKELSDIERISFIRETEQVHFFN